jgi:hypothetical protein
VGFPDLAFIGNEVLALLIVLVPVEIMVLRNVSVFRVWVTGFLTLFKNPVTRKELISEMAPQIGHGIIRALKESAGSAQGVAAKQQQAGLLDSVLQGGAAGAAGLLGLKGKVNLPVVGKVTIGEAIQIAQTLQGLFKGQGFGGGAAPQYNQGTGNTTIK